MRVGHVDGIDRVYDKDGVPRLDRAEALLRHVKHDNIDVSEGSGVRNMTTLFGSTAEKGELYLTTKRLLFIRRPDPFLAAKRDAYALGMADAAASAYRAWDLKEKKAFEYCEIDLAEVEGFWVKKKTYGVLFLKCDPSLTRKAIMYRRGKEDDKFVVLKTLLSERLAATAPEDKKGTFVLGAKYPFLGRGRKRG